MYMGTRLVRYFCIVGPRGHVWSDIAHSYLLALIESGISVRVLPIGSAMGFPRDDAWGHWADVSEAFAGELVTGYVNVVCCPAGQVTGRRITGKAFSPPRVIGVGGGEIPRHVLAVGARATDDVVYEPELALAGLRTDGKRNIAITGLGASGNAPCDAEVEALKGYAAVIAPTEDSAETLRLLGVTAYQYGAEALREEATSLPLFLGDA